MDDTASAQRRTVHLILLIHGLYGSPANLAVAKEEVLKAAANSTSASGTKKSGSEDWAVGDGNDDEGDEASDVVVLVATSFTGAHTWDGIDVNAYRASLEVDAEIERLAAEGRVVDRLSIMGYSLGGLVGRYLAGLLLARPGFFDKIRPVSFSTAATPHLGVLKYGSRLNTIVHTVGRRLFSRSGQQLYCLDREEAWGGRALLDVLADPDCVFLQALKRFEHVLIVANGCHDLTVPYPTATFSLSDPFDGYDTAGMQVDVDENNILRSWHLPEGANPGEREIGVGRGHSRADIPARPFFPPFLYLRWPLTYLLIVLIPFILPLWFCFVLTIMTIHTIQSRRRHRQHTLSRSSSSDLISSSTPLLASSSSPASLSDRQLNAIRAQTSTTSLDTASSTAFISGSSTPTKAEMGVNVALADIPPDVPPRKGQTPLLLTRDQKIMASNLQYHLQHAERIVAWFPWAYNAHAVLVARDVRRFKKHEEGRGVVREWARRVVEAGAR